MNANDRPEYVPPLDRARALAREVLEAAEQVDIYDHAAVVGHLSALRIVTRNLLDALDTEEGQQ